MVRRPSRVLMATGPGLVELRFTQKGPDHRPSVLSGRRDDHPDSAVRVFSERSRRNLQKAALRFPWHEVGRLVLITLTYPADFPLDGRLVKRQVKELWRRWEREYGERPRGIWGLEFQDRGAPHFHAFLGMPRGVDYDDLRGWGFVAWSSIVDFRSVLVPLVGFGGPCAFVDPWAENHYRLENRFNVSPAWFAPGRSSEVIGDYLWRHTGKWAQKSVPVGYVNPGRFWGPLGAGPRTPEIELCCVRAGYAVRRVMVSLLSRRLYGRKRPYRAVRGGLWVQSCHGEALGHRLYLWALRECGCRRSAILLSRGE